MYKIFDTHTHTYPEKIAEKACYNLGAFYDFDVDGKGTYNDLEEHGRTAGVCGFLLFSVATNAHQVEKVNDGIAALVALSRSHGFSTIGFAGMHQDFPDFAEELNRAESLGLHGVKIHPDIQEVDIDDPRMMKLYALMEGRMTLYLHMGDNRPQYRFSEVKKLLHVLDAFPRLKVVAAHLGGYRAWEESPLLCGRENVWYDTSSSLMWFSPADAAALIRKLGTDRCMFGTDYPCTLPETELERFMALPLTETERQNILYNNAAALYGLDS